jgi:hypothetical protein
MSNAQDPLRNPLDPLHKTGPEAHRELFRRLAAVANGFSTEAVVGAAVNMLINAIRQSHAKWTGSGGAEARFNEIFGRHKEVLKGHYDGAGNRKPSIFPFDQTIHMAHHHEKDQFRN